MLTLPFTGLKLDKGIVRMLGPVGPGAAVAPRVDRSGAVARVERGGGGCRDAGNPGPVERAWGAGSAGVLHRPSAARRRCAGVVERLARRFRVNGCRLGCTCLAGCRCEKRGDLWASERMPRPRSHHHSWDMWRALKKCRFSPGPPHHRDIAPERPACRSAVGPM